MAAGNIYIGKDFVVPKRLNIRHCSDFPLEWKNIALSYTKRIKKAHKENPPGFNVLLVAVLQALASKDKTYIDKAAKLVDGNMPDDAVLSLTGAAFCSLNFYDEGLGKLRQAVNINPSVSNIVALTDYLVNPEDYAERLRLCSSVLAEDPQNATALHHAAVVLMSYERWGEAEKYIKQEIEISPKDANTRELMGDFLYERGAYKVALSEFMKALKYCKGKSGFLLGKISYCHYLLGQLPKAKRVALKFLEAHPNDNRAVDIIEEVDGRKNLGIEYCVKGFNQRAYPFLKIESSREKKPGAATLYLAAMETIRTKNISHIEETYKAVENNIPEDNLLTISGLAKFDIGFEETGLGEMRKAVELNPSVRNTYNLAVCVAQKPEYRDEARKLFKYILSIESDSWLALWEMAKLENDCSKALELFNKASNIKPNIWEICYDAGESLRHFEHYEEAIRQYEKARHFVDKNPAQISLGIAYCYSALNNYKECIKNAERAVFENPSFKDAIEFLNKAKETDLLGGI